MNEKLKALLDEINARAPTFTGQIRASVPVGERAEGETPAYELSFSSEEPYERWFGIEILGHANDEVRLDWIGSGNAPLLLQHSHIAQIGVIDSARLENGRGKAVVRFGRSALAQEIQQDVDDGIRKNVSVGYRIHKMVLEKEEDGVETYRVTDWEPYEVSIVSVPADQSVGTNRAKEPVEKNKPLETKEYKMDWKKLARELGLNEDASPEAIMEAKAQRDAELGRKQAEEQHRAETKRRDDILAIAKKHGLESDAKKFIDENRSPLEFGEFVSEKYREGYTPLRTAGTKQEQKDLAAFSMRKFLTEAVEGNFTGIEREMVEEGRTEMRQVGVSSSGIYLPHMVVSRSSVVGSAANAGNLVETERRGFVDALRAKLWMTALGVQHWDGLVGNVEIPRDNAAFEGESVTETGGLTVKDLNTGLITLEPQRIGAAAKFSLQLLRQGSIAVDNFITEKCAAGLALRLNRQAISGTGTGAELLGLLSLTGANAVILGADGAKLDWAKLVEFETKIDAADADVGTMAVLTNNAVKGALKTTQKVSGQSEMLWADKPGAGLGEVNGYNALATNLVPSDLTKGTSANVCSAMIQGVFDAMILGSWGGLDIVIQREKFAETGEIGVVVNGFYGLAYEHEEAFSVAKDILV